MPNLAQELAAAGSVPAFVQSHVLGRTPWIFSGDEDAFENWRAGVRGAGGIARAEVFIVGSASTGYSMKPGVQGRPFKALGDPAGASDVDVAIVDPILFTSLWESAVSQDERQGLRGVLRDTFGSRQPLQTMVEKLRSRVYWGMIAERVAEPGTQLAARVRSLLSAASRPAQVQGYRINARVYRRRVDLERHLGWAFLVSPSPSN